MVYPDVVFANPSRLVRGRCQRRERSGQVRLSSTVVYTLQSSTAEQPHCGEVPSGHRQGTYEAGYLADTGRVPARYLADIGRTLNPFSLHLPHPPPSAPGSSGSGIAEVSTGHGVVEAKAIGEGVVYALCAFSCLILSETDFMLACATAKVTWHDVSTQTLRVSTGQGTGRNSATPKARKKRKTRQVVT
eukprot:1606017-Rhodomonas_salina.1